MNIKLSLFVRAVKNVWYVGGHHTSDDGGHEFYGVTGRSEVLAVANLLKLVDSKNAALGEVHFLSITTEVLDFLCTGKSKSKIPPSETIISLLKEISSTKGTKFKKNATPSASDALGLSYADMMCIHITRKHHLDGDVELAYSDNKNLSALKKSYKKINDIFLGTKIFTWGDTRKVAIGDGTLNLYYTGAYTSNNASSKKDKSLSNLVQELNRNLYTYYTGSNSKLTDAGQRSLDEIRSITLVNEPHPIIEAYLEMHSESLDKIDITPVTVGNIDKIVGSASSNRIMSGEKHWFSFNEDSGDMTFNGVTRSDVSNVFYPQRLGPRIRNEFRDLERKFLGHLADKPISDEYDITDLLYEYSENGKGATVCKPNSVLNGKFNFLKIPDIKYGGRKFTVKYVFTIDGPSVRILSKLVKLNPKVSMVFETLSDTTYTYYTIIRTDIGISIYHCPEGSRLIRRRSK